MTGISTFGESDMRALLVLVGVFLMITGCARRPAFDQKGKVDLTYERIDGQGHTTDTLHITTDFSFPEGLTWKPGEVASWVYCVHPQTKKEFMHQFATALAKHRVDLIGKQSTSIQDAPFRRLQIRGGGLDIDALVFELRDPERPDAIWTDPSLTAMRGMMADVRLMAELCAIKFPERFHSTPRMPNFPPEPTDASHGSP